MSSLGNFSKIIEPPLIWRGAECARVAVPSVPTGFPALDAALPGGGWPAGALTEIHFEHAGTGELQLIMPALARLGRAGRWIALIAPPHVPYAPALAAHSVALSRLMLVRPKTTADGLWACEQALRSGSCGAVLAWPDHVNERALRRLQLAAETGAATALIFRCAGNATISPSPAALRLHVSSAGGKTVVRILKRRGGGVPVPIALDLERAGLSRAPDRGFRQHTFPLAALQ